MQAHDMRHAKASRRTWLRWGCAHCVGLAAGAAGAQPLVNWTAPARLQAPSADTDEGGLWAVMEREERRLRRSPFLLRDPALQRYLEGIVQRLAGDEHMQDMRVYAVRQSMFNASMAPNGMMQVWSGLLLRVENEAQLAAVIGHEIGHFFERHTLQRLRDAKSRSAFGMFLGLFGVVGLLGQLATVAGAFGFSRDHERQADLIGVQLMRRAGYDTSQAARVWHNLQQEMAVRYQSPGEGSLLFATHPPSEERRQSLEQMTLADPKGHLGEQELFDALANVRLAMLDDELRRGQYAESLVLLERWVSRHPQRADFLHFRGEALRLRAQAGDADAALRDLEQAAVLDGTLPITHRSLGYLWRQKGERDKAVASFQRYLSEAPAAGDVELIRSELNALGGTPT